MTDFQLTEYSNGKKFFTIKSERFYIRNRPVKPFNFRIALGKSIEMENVEVSFYKDGNPVSYLDSKSAIMDAKKKDVVFKGRPSLVTEDRRTLTAKKIVWDNSNRRFCAQGHCRLGADGKIHEADLIDTDIELRNFSLIDK